MSAPYSSKAVANSFLNIAKKNGVTDISPMKLQKLIYYAHAWQEKLEVLCRCKSLESEARNAAALRRAKAEMFVSFLLATISMTVGGALISSYPITNSQTPWQFSFGWALIVMAVLMGVFGRAVVWLVVHKFPKYFHEAA